MTGEESYHESCFACAKCNNPIQDLVFAKDPENNNALICMSCNENING